MITNTANIRSDAVVAMERAQAAVAISNRALHQIILHCFTTESRCAWFFFLNIVSTIVSGLYQRVVKNEGEVDSKCPLIEGIPYGGTDFNDYTTGNRYSYTILIDRFDLV